MDLRNLHKLQESHKRIAKFHQESGAAMQNLGFDRKGIYVLVFFGSKMSKKEKTKTALYANVL